MLFVKYYIEFANYMIELFKEGWLGNLFGVAGIVLAIYLYFRPLRVAKPRVMIDGDHALSWRGGDLPEDIEIKFRGEAIPRLGRSLIRFWNAGSGDLDFSEMRSNNPVKIELLGEGRILDVVILSETRDINKCRARLDKN